MNLPIIDDFIVATPTAELVPFSETYTQSDEDEMGMTYNELSVFGRLRKIDKCGPYAMFEKLLHRWGNQFTPREIYDKVNRFFYYYAINRHKQVTITPAVHCDNYSCDDNRFDQRPFLYNAAWTWQKKKMLELLEKAEAKERGQKEEADEQYKKVDLPTRPNEPGAGNLVDRQIARPQDGWEEGYAAYLKEKHEKELREAGSSQ